MHLVSSAIRMSLLLAAAGGFLQQCGITSAIWTACAALAGHGAG